MQRATTGKGLTLPCLMMGFGAWIRSAALNHFFRKARIKATFSFVYNNKHLTETIKKRTATSTLFPFWQGNIPGQYLGGAYKANFFLYQTEDYYSGDRVEEYNCCFG